MNGKECVSPTVELQTCGVGEVLRFIDGKKKAARYASLPDTKAGRKMGLKIYILSKVDNKYQSEVCI